MQGREVRRQEITTTLPLYCMANPYRYVTTTSPTGTTITTVLPPAGTVRSSRQLDVCHALSVRYDDQQASGVACRCHHLSEFSVMLYTGRQVGGHNNNG